MYIQARLVFVDLTCYNFPLSLEGPNRFADIDAVRDVRYRDYVPVLTVLVVEKLFSHSPLEVTLVLRLHSLTVVQNIFVHLVAEWMFQFVLYEIVLLVNIFIVCLIPIVCRTGKIYYILDRIYYVGSFSKDK